MPKQSICASAGLKATGRQYNNAPDTAMTSKPDPQRGHVQHLRVVGEIKAPLVETQDPNGLQRGKRRSTPTRTAD
jgi:hypothetical protein